MSQCLHIFDKMLNSNVLKTEILNQTEFVLFFLRNHYIVYCVVASLANVNILANVNYIKRFTKVPITL